MGVGHKLGESMFRMILGSDLYELARALSWHLKDGHQAKGRSLVPEVILVPNAGIERWLRMTLADLEGVCANLEVSLPAHYLWQAAHRALGDMPDAPTLPWNALQEEPLSPLDPPYLKWYLYDALPWLAEKDERIARYLKGEPRALMRWQLAERLASAFEEYIVHRPWMLSDWEAGKDPEDPWKWQALVWRELVQAHGGQHTPERFERFLGLAEKCAAGNQGGLPDRILCFGLSSLPKQHLFLLKAIARTKDVLYFMQNSSVAYLDAIRAEGSSMATKAQESGAQAIEATEALIAKAHPLLASLGRSQRDFLRLMYSKEVCMQELEPEGPEVIAPERPLQLKADTTLSRLKAGIVRMKADEQAKGTTKAEGDISVQIHACHGPLREVQVLFDQLLDIMVRFKDVEPKDVAVMMPDVTRYAPAIKAVFEGSSIPYSVSDRPRIASHPMVEAFEYVLWIPESRWTASELIALLGVPAVARRFGLTEGEIVRLQKRVKDAGVRWGLDETTRERMGAGRYPNNSWRFGLDRLLLGLSQATEEAVVEGVVPYADIEGEDAEAVGKLWQFFETLKTWYDTALEELSAKEWHARLQALLESLFLTNMRDQAEQKAKKAIEEALSVLLGASGPAGDRSAPMPWLVVRAAIEEELYASSARQPLLSKGVTFCGMVPLRAVPFRVVCLLGMDDGAFPRQEGESGLNLIQSSRWIGERALPEDDRLLFLQCIMAAKDVFYVSYTCMDVQAGTILEPSPVVLELLDFIEQSLLGEGERGAQEGLNEDAPLQSPVVHAHPMQPFSLRYLNPRAKGSRVFTFSERWAKASLALAKERQEGQPRLIGYDPAPLKQGPLKEGVLELANLKSFFKNPTKFFFEECLGVSLPEEEEELPDDEPFELDGLARWSLRERLFSYAKKTGEAILKEPPGWVRGTGKLAPPPVDLFQYGKELEGARKMLEVWNEWRNEASPRSVFVQAELELGLRVVGVVGDVWFQEAQPVGIRKVLNGDVGLHTILPAWIDYLAWVLHGGERELCLVGIAESKGGWSLVGPKRCTLDRATAKDTLQSLVNLYLEGQEKPLPFMPRLTGSFWQEQDEQQSKKAEPFDWLSKKCDLDDEHAWYEAKDSFFRLHLPVTRGMAEEFERIARAVCGPIAACLNDPSSSS